MQLSKLRHVVHEAAVTVAAHLEYEPSRNLDHCQQSGSD
jgi:hypothetical protein